MHFAAACKELVVDRFGYQAGKDSAVYTETAGQDGFGQMFEDVWLNREERRTRIKLRKNIMILNLCNNII